MESFILLLAALLVWSIVIYNLLVRDAHRSRAAWSDIEAQLKRRYDLIPKLVDAVQAYTRFEATTLDEITQLRSASERQASPLAKSALESRLGGQLHQLLAVAEAYPELKTSEQFLNLQLQLSEIENYIQFARRYYNGAVRDLNVRVATFPDLLIARLLRFHPAEFFELSPADITCQPGMGR